MKITGWVGGDGRRRRGWWQEEEHDSEGDPGGSMKLIEGEWAT